MSQSLTKKEERLLKLCREGTAPIREFAALLGRRVRLNIHDQNGQHPLWHVSYCGRSDLADLFIQHGAEVDLTTDKLGETALIIASDKGYLETVKLLLHRGASVNFQRKDGNTALYFASSNNHVEVVKFLLNSGAQVNKGSDPPLYVASLDGRLEITQVLLEHGADVNQPTDTKLRSSPLGVACVNNHLQVAQLLITNGADIGHQNSNGRAPLHQAAYKGHLEVVKLLLQSASHTSLNAKDSDGDTPLHDAVSSRHIEVVRLLLLSQANMEIKNNAGKTPLQVAEEKKHVEIVHLLKTGVPAQSAEVSVSGEAGDGEEPVGEEPPVEALTGEQLKTANNCSQLAELPKEDYVCVARNSLCLVYLPQQVNEKLSIETVTDERLYPCIASNEIIITPVVCITPDNASLALEKPAIIELAKTIELSEKEGDNKVIPLYTKSNYSGWNQLGTGSVVNCRVLQDRISFQVTHFSLYAVISRKPYPSSSVKVKPASATAPPTPDHSSNTHTQLTIPELPGFKVQIPPSSVNVPDKEETDITATVLYDCPAVCSEDERSRLASSCIELEPHGITFTKSVSISIPIPDYAEVMKNHPNAQLQIWHANKCSDSVTELDWNLIEHCISRDEEGRYVAVVLTEHFSWYKSIWDAYGWVKSLFYCPPLNFDVQERCQVFMSQETRTQPSECITFSIFVLFYPYKEDPEPLPQNFKYALLDSGLLELKVSNDDILHFEVELNKELLPKEHKPISGSFTISSPRHRKACTVVLDSKVELKPEFPIGDLTFGIKERPEETYQTLPLIKPADREELQIPTATRSTIEFENTIVVAAKRLKADASEYKRSPIVETAKRVADMWLEMAQLMRRECGFEGRFKEDIMDLAKSINKESQEVVRVATSVAEACTDRIMKNDVNGVVERIETLSHQLRYLARQEATRQRDEASDDLEACQMLTTNAENLSSAISKALYHTQSASIRVAMEKRDELGLTHVMQESDPITGKQSHHHRVKGDRSREGDHYQDSHERSRGHSSRSSSSRADFEERAATRLTDKDHAHIYYKLEVYAVKWRDIGRGLGFKEGEMDIIQNTPMLMMQGSKSWLGQMLSQWLQWAPGDGRGSEGFATKETLHVALLKANLGQLAQQFQ